MNAPSKHTDGIWTVRRVLPPKLVNICSPFSWTKPRCLSCGGDPVRGKVRNPDNVEVEAVSVAFGTVEVVARGRMTGAACPDCGRFADRIHDRYQRRLKDLPLADQSFVIRLTVRRFICGSADCPRRTFAEPFSRLAAPYARFTTRLNRALEWVGLALAGRAGARLAAQLGFGAGRMTLLRKVMALPDPRFSTPRVLGVDDYAIPLRPDLLHRLDQRRRPSRGRRAPDP